MFLLEHKSAVAMSAAMAMATASPWTAMLASNSISHSNAASQRSCAFSLRSKCSPLRQWQLPCRMSSPQSGRTTTVLPPRAITEEDQQTTTVGIKEFLEDLKSVGRVSNFQPSILLEAASITSEHLALLWL